jgi:hypothetical protein
MCKGWCSLGLVAFLPNLAGAAPIVTTYQSGISLIEIGNVKTVESTDAKTDGRVSVFALSGTSTTPEARTAARSSSTEIAANARIDDKMLFSGTDFTTVLSQAAYSIVLAPDTVFVNEAVLDFVLPPAYLEITNNAELPVAELATVMLADLRFCFATVCSSQDAVFHLQADLVGSWRSFATGVNVTGHAQLDLTPLRNPTIADTGATGFLRTTTVSFPLFQGHLELGRIPRGVPVSIEYILQARATGRLAGNIGIAAVNDPFLLETDPVLASAPLALTLTPRVDPPPQVPEPASTWLVALAVAACAGRRVRPGAASVARPRA